MQGYEKEIITDIHDADYNGVCRTSSLMKYIQSTAQDQLTSGGMSYENLIAKKRAFLLSKIRMEISEPVRAYEHITATTYPCESRGFSFPRCYTLSCRGHIVARAVSVWALIDTETRQLVRVSDFDLPFPKLAPLDLTMRRISLPSSMVRVGDYRVCYGGVDQNRHMNNTRYPDIYSDFLPLDGKYISSISISYLHEAPLGTNLAVERGEAEGEYFFRTVRPDGLINSEAEITLSDIS